MRKFYYRRKGCARQRPSRFGMLNWARVYRGLVTRLCKLAGRNESYAPVVWSLKFSQFRVCNFGGHATPNVVAGEPLAQGNQQPAVHSGAMLVCVGFLICRAYSYQRRFCRGNLGISTREGPRRSCFCKTDCRAIVGRSRCLSRLVFRTSRQQHQ
jgi:hypothetical protein